MQFGFEDKDTVIRESDIPTKLITLLQDSSPLNQRALYKEYKVRPDYYKIMLSVSCLWKIKQRYAYVLDLNRCKCIVKNIINIYTKYKIKVKGTICVLLLNEAQCTFLHIHKWSVIGKTTHVYSSYWKVGYTKI